MIQAIQNLVTTGIDGTEQRFALRQPTGNAIFGRARAKGSPVRFPLELR